MILKDLIEIMGRAIVHRNTGERGNYSDAKKWIEQADAIEKEAIAKAKKLSPTAGSLVEWLDRLEPKPVKGDVGHYIAILSTVIKRVRGLMERYS